MNIASLKEVVSAEEWALRVQLAACYRLGRDVRMDRHGLQPSRAGIAVSAQKGGLQMAWPIPSKIMGFT
jgi:hypothetical protein